MTELGESDKLFLNRLQSFLPLAVSDVGFCSLLTSKPILFIQTLNVADFRAKTRYLFPKNFKLTIAGNRRFRNLQFQSAATAADT